MNILAIPGHIPVGSNISSFSFFSSGLHKGPGPPPSAVMDSLHWGPLLCLFVQTMQFLFSPVLMWLLPILGHAPYTAPSHFSHLWQTLKRLSSCQRSGICHVILQIPQAQLRVLFLTLHHHRTWCRVQTCPFSCGAILFFPLLPLIYI